MKADPLPRRSVPMHAHVARRCPPDDVERLNQVAAICLDLSDGHNRLLRQMMGINDPLTLRPQERQGIRYNRRGDTRFKVLAAHGLVCRVQGTRSECWRVTDLGRAVARYSRCALLESKDRRLAALARRTVHAIPGLTTLHFMTSPEFARMRERA